MHTSLAATRILKLRQITRRRHAIGTIIVIALLALLIPRLDAQAVIRSWQSAAGHIFNVNQPATAAAVTIIVNDGGGGRGGPGCKLRDAVEAAITDSPRGGCPAGSGDDIIQINPEAITLTERDNNDHGANGLWPITSGVTIIGNGTTIQRAANAEAFRFFYVAPTGRLELRGVYLEKGYARGGAGGQGPSDDGGGGGGAAGLGGAIYNRGTLTILNSALGFNTAEGGAGGEGGRGVQGTNDNLAGGGGGGGGLSGMGGNARQDANDHDGGAGGGGCGATGGGVGGDGGGEGGGFDIVGRNSSGFSGGAGGSAEGGDGGRGDGSDATARNGKAGTVCGGGGGGGKEGNGGNGGEGAGGGGGGEDAPSQSDGDGNGGSGGFGGGGGGGGESGRGGNAGFGGGGGGAGSGHAAHAGGSGLSGGNGGNADGGFDGGAGGGGGAALGGAIFNQDGTVTLTNVTISGNNTIGGTGGRGTRDEQGRGTGNQDGGMGQALGGGLYSFNGTLTINNTTFSGNSGLRGGGIFVYSGSTSASITLRNTIVANSSGNDCFVDANGGALAQAGDHNLIESNGGGGNACPGVLVTADPNLGPFIETSLIGDLPTHYLNPGSPAIDQGLAAGGATTDQRGRRRPVDFVAIGNSAGGDGSDIGAYEEQDGAPPTINCPADITTSPAPGACNATVSYTVTASDDTAPAPTVECSPPSGQTYPPGTTTVNCTARDSAGKTTNCSFNVTVNSSTPNITTQPANQTVPVGSTATFTAAASGDPAPTVQWQVSTDGTNFTNIGGATNPTLTLQNVTGAQNDNRYRAIFTNACGSATTNAARLIVNPPYWSINGPDGGFITSLLIDSNNPDTLYAATFDDGVYKTTDGGASWVKSSVGLNERVVRTLAFAPGSTTTIYAGGGFYGGSVYRTTNGGSSWSKINSTSFTYNVHKLAINPSNANIMYAGGNSGGVWKSMDGGVTWMALAAGPQTGGVRAILINPSNPNILYVGIDHPTEAGIYKSTDAGATWTAINTGLSHRFVATLAFEPGNAETLYAGITVDGVYRSTNGGATWSKVSNNLADQRIITLAVDPADSSIIYAGTPAGNRSNPSSLHKTSNRAASWNRSSSGLSYVNVVSLAINPGSPNVVYAGTFHAGIFKSTDGGATWNRASSGIKAVVINDLLTVRTSPTTIYAATPGGIHKSRDAGATWLPVDNGLFHTAVSSLAVDPNDTSIVYAGTGDFLYKSINGGATWNPTSSGSPGGVLNDVAIDPQHTNVIYVATHDIGVFKSLDGGATWTEMNNGITVRQTDVLAIHPTNSNILYVGATNNGGIFKSINGGQNWTSINNGLTHFDVVEIAIDPNHPEVMYISPNGGVIFKSTNGGGNWVKADKCLAGSIAPAIAINPAHPATVYAGTNGTINKSTSGGTIWKPINGPPVNTLKLDPNNPNIIYAGTNGTSLFRYETDGSDCLPPTITEQPASQTVDPNTSAVLTAAALERDCVSYQWRKNGARLTDTTNVSGVTTSRLVINAATAGDAGAYDVVITGACGIVTTTAATLTVNCPLPNITAHPADHTAQVGGSAFFVATASNNPAPTVQWQVSVDGSASFRDIDGATNTTLNIANVNFPQNGYRYRAIFTNACGSATTNIARLFVVSPQWVTNGPYGGVTNGIAVDPTNANIVYVGTDGSGVFKTTNGGASWSPANGCDHPGPRTVAIDPTNSNRVYAGNYVGSVSKSVNAGAGWRMQAAGLPGLTMVALAINPLDPNIVYVGTHGGGVYKSSDGGITWNAANAGMTDRDIFSLVLDPQNPNVLYAGDARGTGVYKTTNGGGSWAQINVGLTAGAVQSLAHDPMVPNVVYAGTAGSGIFKSSDGGAHWSLASGAPFLSLDVFDLAVSPADSNVLLAATNIGIFRSNDGAATWSRVTQSSVAALDISRSYPAIVYASSRGVIKSSDGGVSWQVVNEGLAATDNAALVIDSGSVYTAAAPIGIFKTTDSGLSWNSVNNGLVNLDTRAIADDPNNQAVLYAGSGAGVFKTTNGGANWAQTGLTQGLVTALAVTPGNSSTVYAGTIANGVYKSGNGGGTWTQINNGLTASHIAALLVRTDAPQTIYAGTIGGGVFRSSDGGASWAQINTGLTHSGITSLALDPSSANTVYAGGGGVYKSTNGGNSWTRIDRSVLHHVLAVNVAPDNPAIIYAGTHMGGVYRSIDGGATWSQFNPGLDVAAVSAIAFNPQQSGAVYLATSAGVYSLGAGGTPCAPPVVTTEPADQQVCGVTTASFSVEVTGSSLTYQWLKDGTPLTNGSKYTGTNTATLTINSIVESDAAVYEVLVTGSCGQTASCPARLLVNSPPAITLHPASRTVGAGGTATFTAAANGDPTPSVRWQVSTDNGQTFNDIPGQNSLHTATLTLNNVSTAQNGYKYRAVFTNSCGSATTVAATLTVNACIATLSQTSQSFAANGGTGSFSVTIDAGCTWAAVNNNPSFITITAPTGTITGSGTISYTVAGHSNTTPRNGTIAVAGQTFTVVQGAQFNDVPLDHPFYAFIGKLSARGITLGCGNGNFCPEAEVTREQMAAFIIRALHPPGYVPPVPPQQRFADVLPGHLFYGYIDEMALRQITFGCSGNPPIYCPTSNVTREQMAAFVIRALHEPGYVPAPPTLQRFQDVLPSDPFYAYIEEMAARQITLGCSDNPPLFCPTAFVTRAQMAAFLVRAFGL